jgi:hypothetical protein
VCTTVTDLSDNEVAAQDHEHKAKEMQKEWWCSKVKAAIEVCPLQPFEPHLMVDGTNSPVAWQCHQWP